MLRLLSTAVLCVGLMSGCATTEKLMDKVHIGSSDSATPLQQVLNIHPDLKKASSNMDVRQVFNRAESPTAAQVIVTQTGLMDDSVHSVQTIYYFKREDNSWMLENTEKLYRCARGSNTKTFQKAVCP